ncbi:MAG: V-type ATP synthase subunit D [Casimicrobiaceae bacterium]
MSDATPTRSVVLEMKDERRAMHDGYVFLDEKCLLLAGEMLRELERYDALRRTFSMAHAAAIDRLRDAIARHGLQGLEVYPGADAARTTIARTARTLMGVRLQGAELAGELPAAERAIDASPEAEACRRAFTALSSAAAPLAAVSGNLERLSFEYKRSVRRARALQDVLLPELDRDVSDLETRLEELEQEDAIWMRRGRS